MRLKSDVSSSIKASYSQIETLENRRLLSTMRLYMMGNSMTDQVKYAAFDELATSRGHDQIWGRQTILGSPISTIWQNPTSGFTQSPYNQYGNALRNYTWDALTLNPTDRDMYQADGQGDVANALNLINYARQKSPNVQPYILQRTPRRPINADGSFVKIDYPTRYDRPYSYGDNLSVFARDYFNELVGELRREQPTGSKPVRLIPVGDVVYELDARIKRGEVPGMTDINQIYIDQSHYNNIGAYITGLTFFATIYSESPVGLGVPNSYGGTNTIPTAMRNVIQDAVWDVVTRTPYTGVTRTGDSNRAPFAQADAKTIGAPANRTISFDARGSTDVDGDAISYRWSFGDGTTGTGSVATKTYSQPGEYTAVLTVTDSKGASKTDSYTLVVGSSAPQLSISNPFLGKSFKHGDTISLAGTATDAEDGALAGNSLSWKVVHYANQSATTIADNLTGSAGSFVANHLLSKDPDRFYRVTLTATDSAGVQRSIFNDVRPQIGKLTLASNISGIKLSLDTQTVTAGSVLRVTGNTPYTLSAPLTQVVGGKTYNFVSWSDGGAATHVINAPGIDKTLTAQYALNGTTPPPPPPSGSVTTRLAAAADATVRDGTHRATNFGNAATLDVKWSGTSNSPFNRESFLRFSLSNLPAGAHSSIKLRLYGKLDNTGQINVPIGLYAVGATTWSETAVTFATKPATSSKLGQITVANTTSKWYEVNVTSYVKAQLAAGKTAVAFGMKALATSGPLPTFTSGEGGGNAPQLVVTTTPPPARAVQTVVDQTSLFAERQIESVGMSSAEAVLA